MVRQSRFFTRAMLRLVPRSGCGSSLIKLFRNVVRPACHCARSSLFRYGQPLGQHRAALVDRQFANKLADLEPHISLPRLALHWNMGRVLSF